MKPFERAYSSNIEWDLVALTLDDDGPRTLCGMPDAKFVQHVRVRRRERDRHSVSNRRMRELAGRESDARVERDHGCSAQGRIETQTEFISGLTDALKSGIGTLVDADMEEASARLQALQVQQQLGVQALSIANQAPQSILALFR